MTKKSDTCVGKYFRIVTKWGEYIVKVAGVRNYKDGGISGYYWHRGIYIGLGLFPLCEIELVESLNENRAKKAIMDAKVSG